MPWQPESDAKMIDTRYNFFWIHNVFGSFVKDTMEYFSSYLYPRFEWKIVATYDKAVEYLNKEAQYGRQTDQPMKPALVLDPSGDFGFDDSYGKLAYRFPNLAPGFAKYVYTPIYQDKNVIITVAFGRMVGEFQFTALLSSFYEYTDMRVFLNLVFGGENRFIYPQWFNSFIILPPEIYNYTYVNDVTGETYKIDLADAHSQLVKTTNTDEIVYPCRILPRYKLTSMSDASTKLGGSDSLPEWKLNFTLSYECEMPTYIVLETDYWAEHAKININYGSVYSENSLYNIPVNVDSFESTVNMGLDETSNSVITYPGSVTLGDRTSKILKDKYLHIITHDEEIAPSTISISIPERISSIDLLTLVDKNGIYVYGDYYTINILSQLIIIDKTLVSYNVGDVLEIYIYEYN